MITTNKRFLYVGLILLAAGLVYYFGFYRNTPVYKEVKEQSNMENNIPGLQIEILKEGNGTAAVNGNTVIVNYLGTLENGIKFDSSYDRGEPFSFVLGQGYVIKGWEYGVLGMKIGEKRKLTIAPELAYGSRQVGTIPPNSTLIFEVELLEIK